MANAPLSLQAGRISLAIGPRILEALLLRER